MVMAATTKKQPAAAASTAAVVDPKFEWAEKAGTYVLRLSLPGFRKDDFRVQVDGAGRLTVRGARPAAAGLGSFHKVFQLPSAASLDDIAGRFEAGVLTLTMPKRAADAAPTSIEELKRKPSVAKEEDGGMKKGDANEAKEEVPKEEALRKDTEEATEKAQEKKLEEEDVNKSRNQEQQQQKQAPAPMKQEETVKPKAPQGEAAGQTPLKPAPKPEVATGGDTAKETESLAERVRQRGEEERAKAKATTPASATEAKAEPEKKVIAWCSGNWKERMAGELKVLTDMKWADGMVEAARNNKEVVAVGVAAFSLGLLVSHKLFRK